MGHSTSRPVEKPKAFHVPPNLSAVLDFSEHAKTPESSVKRELLSHARGRNSVSLVGMGGVGKTTILKEIGYDKDIWARYPDGVWFISLGQDANVATLMEQLEEFIREACPQFVEQFLRMGATDRSHAVLFGKLFDQLRDKSALLIFDDIWDVSSALNALVKGICAAVRKLPSASLKLLTSTRDRGVARRPLHDVQINMIPDASDIETAERILCHYANVEVSKLQVLSGINKDAVRKIVQVCAGLPLALSVAGTSVLREMEQLDGSRREDAWNRYWTTLQHNVQQLGESGSLEHLGLYASLQSSLEAADEKWAVEKISSMEMFRSLSVLQKQSFIPLTSLNSLWNLPQKEAKLAMDLLIETNIASAAADEEITDPGLKIHDLVHDFAMRMTEENGEVQVWHAQLVDEYYSPPELPDSVAPWKKLADERYMAENIVWHMLGAGRSAEALQLLTDFSWIQHVNQDEKRLPFHKIMSDLRMLRDFINRNGCDEQKSSVVQDIGILVETMEKCLLPFCMNNRGECPFQLYGRLSSLRSDSSVIRRVMWGIEQHSARPWIRAGAGVLSSVDSELKRLLGTQMNIRCMEKGLERDELVFGGIEGEVRVIGCNDSMERYSLGGHKDWVVGICVDRANGVIYSCSRAGVVNVCKKNTLVGSFQVKLGKDEKLWRAVIIPTRGALVVGSSTGNVRIVDTKSRRVLKCVNGHSDGVGSLGTAKSEKIFVSASYDHTIRVWDVDTWTPIGDSLTGHTGEVMCVSVSPDENMMASASFDMSVRLWSVQQRRQICEPLMKHEFQVWSVVFSGDGGILFSAGENEVVAWDVRDATSGVPMIHRFCDTRMVDPFSLVLSDDESQLFVADFRKENVFVWDAERVSDGDSRAPAAEHSFLRDIEAFGVSADGAFIAGLNKGLGVIELRKLDDVYGEVDDVIERYEPEFSVDRIATCSSGKYIAYCGYPALTVYVVDISSGETLYTFSELEDWTETFEDHDGMWLQPNVFSLRFNPEGTVLSARASVQEKWGGERVTKSASWRIDTAAERDESVSEHVRRLLSGSNTEPLRLSCDFGENLYLYSGAIQMNGRKGNATLATLDHMPWEMEYLPRTRCFWTSREGGGLEHVQLVTEETKLKEWPQPQLPALRNTRKPRAQPLGSRRERHTQSKKYRVFISHAGPDKETIARKVYAKLKALGFDVFLDIEELQPGQDAPREMKESMECVSIAVVILSPEFAARKWTMRELMCFLERFKKDGERGMIIIPVFYRLGLMDFGDVNTLLTLTDETGANAFDNAGYWARQVEERGSLRDVIDALQALWGITGIENKIGATNGEGEEEEEKRMELIDLIVDAVIRAQQRLDDGSAAGPSLQRTVP